MLNSLLFFSIIIFIIVRMWKAIRVVTTFSSPVIGKCYSSGKHQAERTMFCSLLGKHLYYRLPGACNHNVNIFINSMNMLPISHTSRYLIILSPRGPSCHYKPVIAPRWKLWDFIDYFVDKLSKGKIKHWDFIFECCVGNIIDSNVPGVLPNLFCSTKCWLNISLLRWSDILFHFGMHIHWCKALVFPK